MLLRTAAFFFALIATATSEIVHLKSGGQIEGEIVSRTPEAIVIRVGERIRENKTIPTSEIDRIEESVLDKPAYEKLKGILPTGDLLTEADYQKLLSGPNAFLEEFAKSDYAEDVKKLVVTLEEEMKQVADGEVKLNGEWITSETIARDRYNHEAAILRHKFNKALEKKDYRSALVTFDELSTDYSQAIARVEAVSRAQRAIDEYEESLKKLLTQNERELARRMEDLKTRTATERAEIERTFQQRVVGPFLQEYERAEEAREKWLPVSKWSKESIEEAVKTVGQERAKLAKLDTEKLGKGARDLAAATASLADGNFEEAEEQMRKAQSSAGYGRRLQELREEINDAKRKAVEDAEKARKAAEEGDMPGENGPGDEGAEGADKTAGSENTGKKDDGTETSSTSSNSDGSYDPDEPYEPEEESTPIWVYLIGLAVVMGLVSIILKKRKSGEEDEE